MGFPLALKSSCYFVAMISILTTVSRSTRAEIRAEKSEDGVTVTIAGGPFAEYLVKCGHQPVIWPIIGPGGQEMTKRHDLPKTLPSETDVHPHHRSMWFSYGLLNGRDFWGEPPEDGRDNQIVHRGFAEVSSGDTGRLVANNDWISNGEKICEDKRTITFGVDAHGRWIDFAVEMIASNGDLVFGDSKEGAFGLRVPATMAVDAKEGGRILNSAGQTDEQAWGRAAEWVDYHGPVDGKPAGIAVFSMPDSFRHPTRWHVRTYGLFAANPIGQKEFPADDIAQGEVTLKRGSTLRLHYRVLFYNGELANDQIADIYKAYSKDGAAK